MKRIGILGSTGSVGKNALRIARHLQEELCVTAIAARTNSDLLLAQALEFRPKLIALWDKQRALELARKLPEAEVIAGSEGIEAFAAEGPFDLLLSAIAGAEGIVPTLRALQRGMTVALANKEALVAAGNLVMKMAQEKKANLIPVDSEHTALFQCLKGEKSSAVHRIILTASGGPFREYTSQQLALATVEEALCHPNYRMGPKVTIDSSTLMNKGLEMIEAHHLYGITPSQIEVVVHPEQVIHSFVEFIDGSILAQLSEPDMLFPIQYALTYPKRIKSPLPPFNFQKYPSFAFSSADFTRFRCLDLAYQALKMGGSMPCYMNAANEALVTRFLNREIKWIEIGEKLDTLMQNHQVESFLSLEKVLSIDAQARQEAASM